MTDLRTKAAKCDFQTHESDMIRDKIVFRLHDTRIKERLLREADLKLARALDVCRTAETSKHQMDTMVVAHTQMHIMHTQKKRESSWENISQRHEDLYCDRHEGTILVCEIIQRIIISLYVPHSMGTEAIPENAIRH